jgi:3-oxoacyl-[acyl-carrier protein] reductase
MRLQDKVAVVTGGAYGLGNAYVTGYANEGARVVIADIDFKAAKSAEVALVEKGKEAMAIKVDVSSADDTQEMAKTTVERFGRVDILVNNAAIFGRPKISRVPFDELDLDEWDKVMAVNIKGVFLCCRAVFPYMKAQGSGKIINISSGQFHTGGGTAGGVARYAHYVTSKGAVIGLTRALSRELGEYNINVNCIAPGSTFTEDPSDQASLELRRSAIASRSLKRIEYPEDVVGTAIFLASSDSDFITGQTIIVNGGGVMV